MPIIGESGTQRGLCIEFVVEIEVRVQAEAESFVLDRGIACISETVILAFHGKLGAEDVFLPGVGIFITGREEEFVISAGKVIALQRVRPGKAGMDAVGGGTECPWEVEAGAAEIVGEGQGFLCEKTVIARRLAECIVGFGFRGNGEFSDGMGIIFQ